MPRHRSQSAPLGAPRPMLAGPRPTRASSAAGPSIGNRALGQLLAPDRGASRYTIAHAESAGERGVHRATAALATGDHGAISKLPRVGGGHHDGFTARPSVARALDGLSGGRPLAGRTERALSKSTGHDLAPVRVFDDDRADAICRQIGAKAATVGSRILFRKGAYQPDTRSGRELLTHEVLHPITTGHLAPKGRPRTRTDPGRLVHRFILRFGDDDYVKPMVEDLQKGVGKGEGVYTIQKKWKKKGTYKPNFWNQAPLSGVPDTETLRVVAHGSLSKLVGGYDGAAMAALVESLGLPKTHTGGVDFHACLPARKAGGTSFIKSFKTNINASGYTEASVRGYEHTIFPDGKEVHSEGFNVYTLHNTLWNESRNPKVAAHRFTDSESDAVQTAAHWAAADRNYYTLLKTYAQDGVPASIPKTSFTDLANDLSNILYYTGRSQKAKLVEADDDY